MVFCRPEDRLPIVRTAAEHLVPDGWLVVGFDVESQPGALTIAEYDAMCAACGLVLSERSSTWSREPYAGGPYAVSVHRAAD